MKIKFFSGSIKHKLRVHIAFMVILFIGISVLAALSLYDIRKGVLEHGQAMGDSTAQFTEQFIIDRTTKVLEYDAYEKSRILERELSQLNVDLTILSDVISLILEHPENYKFRSIEPFPTGKVKEDTAYLIYSPELRTKGVSPSAQNEIGLVGNLGDIMSIMSKRCEEIDITCCFVSEKGYTLYISSNDHNDSHKEDINYDNRNRPWYKLAKEKKKDETVASDIYFDDAGNRVISFATPCYKNDEFVGVIGIVYKLEISHSNIMKKTLGEGDINFAINNKGELLFSSQNEGELSLSYQKNGLDLRNSHNQSLSEAIKLMMTGKSGVTKVTVDNKEYYLGYAPLPTPDWYFATLINKEEMLESAHVAKTEILNQSDSFVSDMYTIFGENIAILTLLFIIITVASVFISRKAAEQFLTPLAALANGVKEIAKGDLDKKLEIKTDDELEYLANCINDMSTELKTYMKNLSQAVANEERISTELEMARDIQEGSLPHDFPKHDKVDLYASMVAAKEVGGDFYDFYRLDENHFVITIADVSGKGVPAALFMMRSKTILKNLTIMSQNYEDVASILNMTNEQLYENNVEMMFVTIWLGILDTRTGELTYANGGHNMPLIGKVESSNPNWYYVTQERVNHMVGIKPNYKFETNKLTLNPGDMLFLYTDGVTEAMNESGELYSDERLNDILNQKGKDSLTAEEILTAVGKDIETFSAGAEQSDDITMLGIKYLG